MFLRSKWAGEKWTCSSLEPIRLATSWGFSCTHRTMCLGCLSKTLTPCGPWFQSCKLEASIIVAYPFLGVQWPVRSGHETWWIMMDYQPIHSAGMVTQVEKNEYDWTIMPRPLARYYWFSLPGACPNLPWKCLVMQNLRVLRCFELEVHLSLNILTPVACQHALLQRDYPNFMHIIICLHIW